MADLIFYTKRECGLCDRLKDLIRPTLERRPDLRVIDVDIERDPGLIEQFRFRVPVVMYDGVVLFEGRPDPDRVREALLAIRPADD